MYFHYDARKVAAALAVTITFSFVTACGSSDDDTSSSAKVDTAGVQEAKDLVAQYSERPTEIPNQKPVDAEIPADKTLVWIDCGLPACTSEAKIIEAATDKLGWDLNVLPTDGTPEKIKAAWQQVLRDKPDGVLYPAFDRAQFEPELKEAAAMGIEVAASTVTDKPDDALDFVDGTPAQVSNWGELQAAWQIAESGGKANTLFVDVSAFKILGAIKVKYSDTMDKLCPGCKHDTIDMPITAVGKDAPNQIVSYLRAHPDVKYVALALGALGAGLPAALKAAGLEDIKVIGEGADEAALQDVSTGELAATIAFPYYELMYPMVDYMIRAFSGVPPEGDGTQLTIPTWLLTKDNLPPETGIFPIVEDIQEQYFKLWGIN